MARTRHLKITVEGKDYDVVVEDVTDDDSTFYPSPTLSSTATRPAPSAPARPVSVGPPATSPTAAAGGNDKTAPMGGVIVEVTVKEGDAVKSGDQILIMEAMKMKQVVTAHQDGKVTKVHVQPGQAVDAGQALLTIE